ncbi:CDP-archaeol synthase [bacterium]|nr:CDP-archaeol synthase [bacterium]
MALMKRTITGLIGIPILLLIIWWGYLPFLFLVCGIVVLALLEFYHLAQRQGFKPFRFTGTICGLLLVILIFLNDAKLSITAGGEENSLLITFFLLLFFTIRIIKGEVSGSISALGTTLLGIFYVAWFSGYLILIRNLRPYGRQYTYILFVTIWILDTAAYLGGMKFGRHKLAKSISPNKTIEGAVTAVLFAQITLFISKWWFFDSLRYRDCFIIALILGIGAQLGDLGESLIKRDVGVKDSGNLLPGHGGVLDRFDSLFFAAPLLYYYIRFFM